MEQDPVLWQKFREGDPLAFEQLLRSYYRPLFDYGRRFISDRDQLKDIVHDLFLHLWERREYLGKTDQIKPYLLTSLRNRIFKNTSRQESRPELFLAIEHTPEDFHETAHSIESELILTEFAAEKLSRIQHIIQSLTPRQQEIIHLKFYQDLSNERIAEILNISRPATANLLYESLKVFREKWLLLAGMLLLLLVKGS
ncbi:DNA-directed RNA polymerase sigma-70 factor [Dyadobacter beijingensis]|uniref:DNA-directed RNA polymerase sigma-70 factor n=1 Tax=Dyadobacter beijingensis TaxID=365489 RepID=A0ABQ2IBD8_9BACT|nr:sigma-70 family RNA polymerase sigma factor [Dyadobacter beijingensis]GGN03302.1 DNA-directed RNA polymerase sigma-70 factor [Dyadobacter beijingensis]